MNRITEHDRKTGDSERRACINGRVERIKAARVKGKKGTCRSAGKVGGSLQSAMVGGRESKKGEASPAEWC